MYSAITFLLLISLGIPKLFAQDDANKCHEDELEEAFRQADRADSSAEKIASLSMLLEIIPKFEREPSCSSTLAEAYVYLALDYTRFTADQTHAKNGELFNALKRDALSMVNRKELDTKSDVSKTLLDLLRLDAALAVYQKALRADPERARQMRDRLQRKFGYLADNLEALDAELEAHRTEQAKAAKEAREQGKTEGEGIGYEKGHAQGIADQKAQSEPDPFLVSLGILGSLQKVRGPEVTRNQMVVPYLFLGTRIKSVYDKSAVYGGLVQGPGFGPHLRGGYLLGAALRWDIPKTPMGIIVAYGWRFRTSRSLEERTQHGFAVGIDIIRLHPWFWSHKIRAS